MRLKAITSSSYATKHLRILKLHDGVFPSNCPADWASPLNILAQSLDDLASSVISTKFSPSPLFLSFRFGVSDAADTSRVGIAWAVSLYVISGGSGSLGEAIGSEIAVADFVSECPQAEHVVPSTNNRWPCTLSMRWKDTLFRHGQAASSDEMSVDMESWETVLICSSN